MFESIDDLESEDRISKSGTGDSGRVSALLSECGGFRLKVANVIQTNENLTSLL